MSIENLRTHGEQTPIFYSCGRAFSNLPQNLVPLLLLYMPSHLCETRLEALQEHCADSYLLSDVIAELRDDANTPLISESHRPLRRSRRRHRGNEAVSKLHPYSYSAYVNDSRDSLIFCFGLPSSTPP